MGARFDDLTTGRALVCGEPREVLAAIRLDEVVPTLEALDRAVAGGGWAYGFVAYEAAPALDPALTTRPPLPGLPLVWFALCDPPTSADAVGRAAGTPLDWRCDWDADAHAGRVAAVRAEIARGETYQVNLTTRLRTTVADAATLYADLAHTQRGAWNAFLDAGRWAVCCASPELLVERTGDRVVMRPMKGTAARGPDPATDAAAVAALRSSAKERAEHVMIVDLVRNDLSRVADDVRATAVGTAERYDPVWQLTGEVTGRLRTRGLVDLLRAVFPNGSVTGAPKAATMALIADLEDAPRGVYCGAVGLLGPDTVRLAVPIRTALVDRTTGATTYGAGGGITWSSDAAAEWAELRAKVLAPGPPRRLLQTLRYAPGAGCRHAERHVAHLAASAAYLGFPCAAGDLLALLAAVDGDAQLRVRLLLDADGRAEVTTAPLADEPATVRLALDPEPVDPADRWLRHKNDHRETYAARLARHPGADDVVLVNTAGRVTETARANLLVHLDGGWWTPPVDEGLLPGVGREVLLESGAVRERRVTVAELRGAEAVATVSSLWGRRPATLV